MTSISSNRALNHFGRVVSMSSCHIIGFEFNVYRICWCWCYTLNCILCTNKIMGSCKAIEQTIMQDEYLDFQISFYLQRRKISCETHCCFLCFLLPSKLFSNLFFSGFCLYSTLVCFCFLRLLDFEKVTAITNATNDEMARKKKKRKRNRSSVAFEMRSLPAIWGKKENKRKRPHPQDVNSNANTNRELQGVWDLCKHKRTPLVIRQPIAQVWVVKNFFFELTSNGGQQSCVN